MFLYAFFFQIDVPSNSALYFSFTLKRKQHNLNLKHSAFAAFGIKTHGTVSVTLTDNMGVQIRKEKLEQFILAFWRSDTFAIEIQYDGQQPTKDVVVTSQVLGYDYSNYTIDIFS